MVSGPPLSGADCGASLVRTAPGAAFFTTQTRLDPDDSEPPLNCSAGNDVYRYDIATEELKCLTCVYPGFGVEVEGSDATKIAVSDDGSRIYFTSEKRLLAGAPAQGQIGIYRLEVASGTLTYIAPLPSGAIGNASSTAEIDADGSVLAFSSDLAFLNPTGGAAENDGTTQFYRYDDEDRSLICVSCPPTARRRPPPSSSTCTGGQAPPATTSAPSPPTGRPSPSPLPPRCSAPTRTPPRIPMRAPTSMSGVTVAVCWSAMD